MDVATKVLFLAIPMFVLLLVLEALSYRFAPDDDERGYSRRDSRTSISMGFGFLVIESGWKIVSLAAFIAIYTATPLRLSAHNPWTWVIVCLADDLVYYLYHRTHHEIRVLWANHVVHHSSEYYNLSTALRQTWTPFTALPFWLPLAAIGIPPWVILLEQSISLIYQFFLHTERIDKLPRPIEYIFNTPSHHRVHHGSNSIYLDRNYGGILIIWDRLFRSFEPEGERVTYGLTKNVATYNPARVAFHEYAVILADIGKATRWRDRIRHLTHGPGWSPETAPAAA